MSLATYTASSKQSRDIENRISEINKSLGEDHTPESQEAALLTTLQAQVQGLRGEPAVVMPDTYSEIYWAKAKAHFASGVVSGVTVSNYVMDDREEAIYLHRAQAIALRDYLISLDMGD